MPTPGISTIKTIMCVCARVWLQVLRDLIQAIRPDVDAMQSAKWTPKFLLRLDGIQQQQRVPAVCDLDTGVSRQAAVHVSRRHSKQLHVCSCVLHMLTARNLVLINTNTQTSCCAGRTAQPNRIYATLAATGC